MNYEFFSLTSLLVKEMIVAANDLDEVRYMELFNVATSLANEENQ